ncbi:UNVERIFIED_CONTAM: hypothetical protein O8I53_13325 [Campylobacter lari]
MIKAKRKKIITSLLATVASVSAVGLVSFISYYSINKNKSFTKDYQIKIEDNDISPKLSRVAVIIDTTNLSNTDKNLELNRFITTTLLYTYINPENGIKQVIKEEKIVTEKDQIFEYNVVSKIPNGYKLDPNRYSNDDEIKVKPGENNDIFIVPEEVSEETTFSFFEKDKLLSEFTVKKNLTDLELRNFDIKSIVPNGYELVENQNIVLSLGVDNKIFIEKIVNKVQTTITFKTRNDENKEITIYEQKITTPEFEQINPNDYLPMGYKFAASDLNENNQVPLIIAGHDTTYFVEPIIRQKITKISFRTNETTVVKDATIITENDQKITLEQITPLLPNGYELRQGFDVNSLKIGSENANIILVDKKIVFLDTEIKFYVESTSNFVYSKSFQLEEGKVTELQQYFDEVKAKGYEIVPNQTQTISAGQHITIYVRPVKNVEKTTLIFVDQNTNAEIKRVSNLELSSQDISSYIPHAYSLVNKNQTIVYGKENTILVSKNKIRTTIKFKNGTREIDTKTFLTSENESIN